MATDTEHDIAILKAPGVRPPAVVRLAPTAPSSGKLFIMGYPATATLTEPAETWAVMENEKFPSNVGSLTNPRDLLWMSAPDVTHGYSGGPIFDPRSGAVVGLVKGEVEGGYLRLVRDMPTTGRTKSGRQHCCAGAAGGAVCGGEAWPRRQVILAWSGAAPRHRILSTISRDKECSPLRSFGSIGSRNRGASVGSVVKAQIVIESVASKLSSCTMTTGRGLPA